MGAKVFSMSFYSDQVSQAEEDALSYAFNKGVLPVAAAGNDYSVFPYYPAGYDFVLAVAATNSDNTKASFSNYGWWVDVAAPGVGLTTTSANGAYGGFSGTSGACPQVAGLAALLKGANASISRPALRNAIEDSATLLSQSPFGEFSSYGLVNARAAMDIVKFGAPVTPAASKVNFIAPIGYAASGTGLTARVFGRNLVGAKVKIGGTLATMVTTTRDSAYFKFGPNTGAITVENAAGELLGSYLPPENVKPAWPMNEASSPGATVTGGFAETLRVDGQVLNCTRRGDGTIQLQMAFRKLPVGAVTLVIKRSYVGGTAGGEKIQLYNWAGASYPYASFTTLRTTILPTASDDIVISIPNTAPYVDFEKTAYLRILTENIPSGAQINVDTAYFRK
jgi:hypothetical protein